LLLQQPPTFALQESAATLTLPQTLPLSDLHESPTTVALPQTLFLSDLHESVTCFALQQPPQLPEQDFWVAVVLEPVATVAV
jgi:hypothetical protein